MTTIPQVSVFNPVDQKVTAQLATPTVFSVPLRNDIVYDVFKGISKNRRQARGVVFEQGHRHSAESWGTGRAVARIPRVGGSGTHRSGQAAFGNMCRKGRMFAPLQVWRRWNRRVNIKQKRQAVCVALAASAVLPLVQARGHIVDNVQSIPLVLDNVIESYDKTKKVVELLKQIGAYADVRKVIDNKNLKQGKGKLRNRRYRLRRGPLIVYNTENAGIVRGARNIPGVEVCHVSRLNLLQLAPGGQIGRFIIWTADAFKNLNTLFGTYKVTGTQKQNFTLNRSIMTNADLARIINSNEIQTAIRDKRESAYTHEVVKKNPLNSNTQLFRLNPNAKLMKAQEAKAQEESIKNRKALLAQKRKSHKAHKKGSKKWLATFNNRSTVAQEEAKQEEKDWIAQGAFKEE